MAVALPGSAADAKSVETASERVTSPASGNELFMLRSLGRVKHRGKADEDLIQQKKSNEQ